MELQSAFYVLGIIFMSVMLILIIALLVAVLVIRNKVMEIQKLVQDKIDEITHIADRGDDLVTSMGGKLVEKAADVITNAISGGKKSRRR